MLLLFSSVGPGWKPAEVGGVSSSERRHDHTIAVDDKKPCTVVLYIVGRCKITCEDGMDFRTESSSAPVAERASQVRAADLRHQKRENMLVSPSCTSMLRKMKCITVGISHHQPMMPLHPTAYPFSFARKHGNRSHCMEIRQLAQRGSGGVDKTTGNILYYEIWTDV